jgi:GNAT superfamily N-acetyltransferase
MRSKDVIIRQATEKDIPGVDDLWEEAAHYHGQLDTRLAMRVGHTQAITEFHTKQLTSEDALFLVAVRKELVVGYAIARVVKTPPHHYIRRVGVIDGIAITNDFRGKGIGSEIFEKVLEWLLAQGIERLDTFVATKNPRAQTFWERKGFVPRMYQISLDLTSK